MVERLRVIGTNPIQSLGGVERNTYISSPKELLAE